MAWGSLISRKMLIDNDIRFVRNAYPREDLVFNLNLLDVQFRGVFVDTVAYIYRYAVAGSLSNSVRFKLVRNYPEIYSLILPYHKRQYAGNLGKLIAAEEESTRMHLLTAPMRLKKSMRKEYLKLLEKFVPQMPIIGNTQTTISILTKIYNGFRPAFRCLTGVAYSLIPKHKRINA